MSLGNCDELVGIAEYKSIPPRSQLGRLRPAGLGSPYRESLSSYVLRLAHNHHLPLHVLCQDLITPKLRNSGAKGTARCFVYPSELRTYNGFSSAAEEWADAVAFLTGQANLRELT